MARFPSAAMRGLMRQGLPSAMLPLGARSVYTAELALKGNQLVRGGNGSRATVSGLTVTLFGASGFVGRYVAQYLGRLGCQLVIPYRCDDTDVQHLRTMGDLGQVVMLPDFNLRSDEDIARAVSRSSIVINLIGADQPTWNFALKEVHEDAARRIARIARVEAPALERFFQFSALGASADAPSERLRTKHAAEAAVAEELGDLVTTLRLAPVTGTEDRLFNQYARLVKTLPFVPVAGAGRTRLQPVWVRDVAQAVIEALHDTSSAGRTYDLAGPKVMTLNEILDLVYSTIRESDTRVHIPDAVAKAIGTPLDWLALKTPIRTSGAFTTDRALELVHGDFSIPEGSSNGTFRDLHIVPQDVTTGHPVEFLRYYRTGGYDVGTLDAEHDVQGHVVVKPK